MKRWWVRTAVGWALLCALGAWAGPAAVADEWLSELVVGFKDPSALPTRRRVHEQRGALSVRRAYGDAFDVVAFRQCDVDRALAAYRCDAAVAFVEPNYRRRALWVPNETVYWRLWNLHQINIEPAWDVTLGDGVIVAVVDSGITPGGDDGFLYPLLPGYNFVDNNPDTTDDNGHGTFVAGVVAQQTDNEEGSVGVAPHARLLPVKVLNARGSGRVSDISSGIRWAADNGARVINVSIGGFSGSFVERRAIAYAHAQGCVITAAAGNNGSRWRLDYPARYSQCIAVGATEAGSDRAYYSNYGRGLDVMAPGGDTYADVNEDGFWDGVFQETVYGTSTVHFEYEYWQGTSMAAPHVAGLAALLFAAHPGWSHDQVRARIESTCVDLGRAGKDRVYGYGLIDAGAALAP